MIDKTPVKKIYITLQLIKGVILGVLLFCALIELVLTASGAALFRYQGF